MKKISIIVLSYNNLQYYKECLSSILEQSTDDIEVVLSDDCSKEFFKYEDDIKKYIEKTKGAKNVIINHNKVNLGIVENLKKAIEISSGEYIYSVAIDDLLYDKEVVKDFISYMDRNNIDVCTGKIDKYSNDLNSIIKKFPNKYEYKALTDKNFELLQRRIVVNGLINYVIFSRKTYNKVRFYDTGLKYSEDYARNIILTKNDIRINYYDRNFAIFRDGGISSKKKYNDKERIKIKEDYEREIKHISNKLLTDVNEKVISNLKLKNKKIICWGASGGYRNIKDKCQFDINYLVDSNKALEGTYIDSLKIYLTNKLLKENKEDIFILICSCTYYYEIMEWLEYNGFKEGEQYFFCARHNIEIYNKYINL